MVVSHPNCLVTMPRVGLLNGLVVVFIRRNLVDTHYGPLRCPTNTALVTPCRARRHSFVLDALEHFKRPLSKQHYTLPLTIAVG